VQNTCHSPTAQTAGQSCGRGDGTPSTMTGLSQLRRLEPWVGRQRHRGRAHHAVASRFEIVVGSATLDATARPRTSQSFICNRPPGSQASSRLVPIFDRRRSRRLPVVEVQKSAQPLATSESARPRRILQIAVDQGIPQPLMVPLVVVVRHVFADCSSKMVLTQRYDPLKTLALDRQNEAFRQGVQVRTVCAQPRW